MSTEASSSRELDLRNGDLCQEGFFSALVDFFPLMLYAAEKLNALYCNIRSSLCLLVLLVICVSYILVYIKVCCGPNLQHHGAANREKQLTVTFVLVTIVSLVTWLPGVVLVFLGTITAQVTMECPLSQNFILQFFFFVFLC